MPSWRSGERPRPFDPTRRTFRTFFLPSVHHRAVDTVRREERLRRRQDRAANLEPLVGEDVAEGAIERSWLEDRRKGGSKPSGTLPVEQRRVLEMAAFGAQTQARRSPRSSGSRSAR